MYTVSFYKNIENTTSKTVVNIEAYFKAIKEGKYKNKIVEIQKASTKSLQRDLKNQLPNITASGTFKERFDKYLQKHSGLVQIDIDKKHNPDLDPILTKKTLVKDSFTFAAFISPTGTGIKLLVKIDPEKHNEIYPSIEKYYKHNYQLQIDTTCRNVSRAMFVSYDPELFNNFKSIRFDGNTLPEKLRNELVTALKLNDKVKEVELLISKIEGANKDITQGYDNWIKIGFAISSEFGITGENYFHRLSILNPEYDKLKCSKQYTECCKQRKVGVTIKTLFEIAKGFNIYAHEPKQNQIRNSTGLQNENLRVGGGEGGKVNMFIQVEKFLDEHFDLRFNEVSNRIEEKKKDENKWKDLNENNIFRFLMHNDISLSMTKLTALLKSDFIKIHNPFKEYFKNNAPYNRQNEPDYITNLCGFVYAKDQDRFSTQLKKHLVRCVACAIEENFYNKQAFIIVHEKQNSGKSTFCRWFCPPELERYLGENVNLTNKDGEIALSEKFLINLDELAALSKYEINQLKSVMSRDKISVRRPFDRSTSESPRRCSFFGSTNRNEFLFDETGSVRWLCFEIELINWDYKNQIDINRIWAQAYHLYNNGFKYEMTFEEIADNERANDKFFMSSPEEDLLQKMFMPGLHSKHDSFMTTTDILKKLQEGCNNAVKINPVVLGRIMQKNHFIKSTQRIENVPVKGYFVNFIANSH